MRVNTSLTWNRLLFLPFCLILSATLIGCQDSPRVRREAPRDEMNEKALVCLQ